MFHNEGKNVTTCDGIILWDGITQPEPDPKSGAIVHTIKIAIPANAPEAGELEQLAQQTLQTSEFKGVLPHGGYWPIMPIDVAKLGDSAPLMTGRVAINAKTRRGAPSVFDINGQELTAMQYGRMLYPGAVVKLLLHCYSYNNVSKGIAGGLDGIQIVDATTPKLDVGGGMSSSEVAQAFGGQVQPGMPAPVVQPGMPAPVVQPGMPAPVVQPSMPAPVVQPVTPNQGFVTQAAGQPAMVPARMMTALAQGATYEQMIAGGWTDEAMIQNGMMQP